MAETRDMRERVATLLTLRLDPQEFQRELEALAHEDDFEDCGDLWAPALYQRDPRFFAPFLLRNLTDDHADVIKVLLPRIEMDGHDELFAGLYRLVTDENDWNTQLLLLAESPDPDEQVMRAVQRREATGSQFTLTEAIANALYRRNPALMGPFVRAHVKPGYLWRENRKRNYADLRDAVRAQGDDDLYWFLFRQFGDPREWASEIRQLTPATVAPDAIISELQQRQLDDTSDLDSDVLVGLTEGYGQPLMPYIEANLKWIGSKTAKKLLPMIERVGDVTLARRIFFTFENPAAWQKKIHGFIVEAQSNDTLAAAVTHWMPPIQNWTQQAWWIDPNDALTLYQLDADRFRAFLSQTVEAPTEALFSAAEDQHDEAFLDILTVRFLDQLSTQISYSLPMKKALVVSDLGTTAKIMLDTLGRRIMARFDRLVAASPETYVGHAASILSHGVGQVWALREDEQLNPMSYLYQRYREAWLRSSAGIRELIETPNARVQDMALKLLVQSGPDAAQRVVENVMALRVIILGRQPRPVKKLALRAIEGAATHNPEFARQLAPALEEMMYYRSRRAIDERVMISFVRARHVGQSALVAGVVEGK